MQIRDEEAVCMFVGTGLPEYLLVADCCMEGWLLQKDGVLEVTRFHPGLLVCSAYYY